MLNQSSALICMKLTGSVCAQMMSSTRLWHEAARWGRGGDGVWETAAEPCKTCGKPYWEKLKTLKLKSLFGPIKWTAFSFLDEAWSLKACNSVPVTCQVPQIHRGLVRRGSFWKAGLRFLRHPQLHPHYRDCLWSWTNLHSFFLQVFPNCSFSIHR